jgi:predicted nucleic acid-binding protein
MILRTSVLVSKLTTLKIICAKLLWDVMFVSLFSTGNVRKTAVATQCAQAFVVRLCEKLRVVSMTVRAQACSCQPRESFN